MENASAVSSAGHHRADYADSYRSIALPAGVAALVVSGAVLLGLWFRRKAASLVMFREAASIVRLEAG